MKRVMLLIYILLFNLHYILGQSLSKHVTIGIDLNPELISRSAWVDKRYLQQADVEWIIYYNEIINNGKPAFGFSAGIPLTWYKDSIRSLETGIYYSQRGFGWYDDYYFFTGANVFCESHGKVIFHFIDIPFLLGYNLYQGRSFNIYSKIGPSINILMKSLETAEIIRPNGSIEYEHIDYDYNDLKDFEYRRLNLSATIIVGTIIPISNRIGIRIEPISSFLLNPVPKEGNIKSRYWEVGIRTGAIMRL